MNQLNNKTLDTFMGVSGTLAEADSSQLGPLVSQKKVVNKMKKVDVRIDCYQALGMDGYSFYQNLVVNIGKVITMDDVRKNKKLSRADVDNCFVLKISNTNTEDGEWQFARKDIVKFANKLIENFGYEIVANKNGEHLTILAIGGK